MLLGFSQDVWELCPQAPCLQRHDYVMQKYGGADHSGVGWNQMNLATQQAWMLLEYTPQRWAEGKEADSQQLTWNELSMEQQKQAEFLGYNLATWAGCYQEWGPAPDRTNLTKPEPLNPQRVVRGRMTIQLPFTDISGNVYGSEVADVPTAFITIFERAVARALFCGNPPLALQAGDTTYTNLKTGEPLCNVKMDYELQRNRVQVLTVVEGSIIVDFLITRNATSDQSSSPQLFAALQELLTNKLSPLCQDIEFGRYASSATAFEVNMTAAERAEMADTLSFEEMRKAYDISKACNLDSDFRKGDIVCPTDGASRSSTGCLITLLFATFAIAVIPSRTLW